MKLCNLVCSALCSSALIVATSPSQAQDRFDQPEPAYSDLMGRDNVDLAVAARWRVRLGDSQRTWDDAKTISFGLAHQSDGWLEYDADFAQLSFADDQISWDQASFAKLQGGEDDFYGLSATTWCIIAVVFTVVLVAQLSSNNSKKGSGHMY
jgi:hypothetical protein